MTSQFSIPGLMTPPTMPKSSNRLQTDYDGVIRAVVHSSSTGSEPVHVQVMKLVPGNQYDRLVNDPFGTTLLRQRDLRSGGIEHWDYTWYYDALSPRLPYGDLQVWVDAAKQPRKIYSLFVPKLEVTGALALAADEVLESQQLVESQWGNIDLPVNTAVLSIPFQYTFDVMPNVILVSLISPSGLGTAEVASAMVAGYDRSGLTVALSSPISISGYKISWYASAAPTQLQSINNQRGQFLVAPGQTSVTIPFRVTAPGIPSVFGTMQATSNSQSMGLLTYVITDVTAAGFTVIFSAAQAVPFLFNWEMHA